MIGAQRGRPFRTLHKCARLSLVGAMLALCPAALEAGQRLVVADVRLENDIGVEKAGPIATQWLMDSIRRAAPHIRLIDAAEAAELARLAGPIEPENISPSTARSLRKSINATHVLGGSIFIWNRKYGVALRLENLSGGPVRVERGWTPEIEGIPAKLDELARLIFAPQSEPPARSSKEGFAGRRTAPESDIPPRVAKLLKKHPEMTCVPGGEFLMGNENRSDADNMPIDPARREGVSRLLLLAAEAPEHTVDVEPFLIDTHEVTNAEYKRFRPAHEFPPEKADHPVTGISWHDARAYAAWAGKRLPTEEEWEKAARGVDGRKWPWGNIFERGRCNLGSDTAPVGSFEGDVSPYGVLDMAGNVQEWTSSSFTPYPGNSSQQVSFDPGKKVVRGTYYGGNDFLARCSMRFCALPGQPGVKPRGENYEFIGFRCAMDVE